MEEPIDIKPHIPEITLQSLFGAYISEETAEEIILEIRASRVFNRIIETL